MNDASDETLINQYRSGNAAAFDRLYQRYRVPVFNYISRQVSSQPIAEDIFQDVWFRVIRALEKFENNGGFPAWIFTIAHNRLTDYWRANKVEVSELSDDLQNTAHSTETMHLIQNCIERLLKLLEKLKPEQRDAFVMQQESGLTLDQIAEVSNCGRETIKSRLRYAMQKLRKGLEGCDES